MDPKEMSLQDGSLDTGPQMHPICSEVMFVVGKST